MTETERTHGPWRVGYSDGSGAGEDGFYCITASGTECVVRSGDSFGLGYGIENAADARLIAAAPDMLACLIEIRALITEAALTGFNCHEGDWAERLFATQASSHAAVRKATGA